MNKVFKLAAVALSLVVSTLCWSQSAAHEGRRPRVIYSQGSSALNTAVSAISTPYFVALQAGFIYTFPASGANADHTDLWPCAGGLSAPNPDCPTVGNPVQALPWNALVTGFPFYGLSLANNPNVGNGNGCDALINGTGSSGVPYISCGDIATYYEDNTNDSTDDLLGRVVVKQGTNIVYDSGLFDLGPAVPSVTYPAHVILYSPTNLGYWPGASVGPNNGNCSASLNYPLTAPTFPTGSFYVVEDGQTCTEPQPGLAKVVAQTSLATPEYTQVTGKACTSRGVNSPCYFVKWNKTHAIEQVFNILLQ